MCLLQNIFKLHLFLSITNGHKLYSSPDLYMVITAKFFSLWYLQLPVWPSYVLLEFHCKDKGGTPAEEYLKVQEEPSCIHTFAER